MNLGIEDIISLLKNQGQWGSRVYKVFPKNFSVYPILSVRMIDNADMVKGDDKGMQVFHSVFDIDLWYKSISTKKTLRQSLIDAVYTYIGAYLSGEQEQDEGDGVFRDILEFTIL